jgi:hypothetical protein
MTMARLTEILHSVGEQVGDLTRSRFAFTWTNVTGIRGFNRGSALGLRFWPTTHPAGEGTVVNYDMARSIYRNDGDNALGASFGRPIVDLVVEFMGIPTATTDSDSTNRFLNECLGTHWAEELQQMYRDAMRDSRVIVRINKPDIFDPLMTIDESDHCVLECLPPERVDLEYDGANKNLLRRAVIRHRMMIVKDQGDPVQGIDPVVEEHDVLEIIDQQSFKFFDQMEHKWIDELGSPNPWGFVNLVEVWNEWDAALQGGQSDLEPVIPFINAFHDVLTQGLQAHAYHSTPKLKLKLADVMPFIRNNFPELLDPESGQIADGAAISWRGREIFFFGGEDDAEFLEARSVLGDTKTLAEFLIDCICIASQTPEWAFMRVDSGSANSDRNAQTVPWIKKVERKRRSFQKPVQRLLKMALVINELIPTLATLTWDAVRPDDQIVEMQAFQQLVMGLEVARSRGEITDQDYQRMIAVFLPGIKPQVGLPAKADAVIPPQLPPAASKPPANKPPANKPVGA